MDRLVRHYSLCVTIAFFPSLFSLHAVSYTLPIIDDVESDVHMQIDDNSLSSDSSHDHTLFPEEKTQKSIRPDFALSSSTLFHSDQQSRRSGRALVHDMFLSQCATGLKPSIFSCSEEELGTFCASHGLHFSLSETFREVKLKLLYHVINGNCFFHRFGTASSCLDRSACLCIASAFSSSLAITIFIISLLKSRMSSDLSTDDLSMVVESLGTQPAYENSIHLRRRLFTSLDEFRHLSERRVQRDAMQGSTDPYGDLFMGFEGKQRSALEDVMTHHGLQPSGHDKKISKEEMRDQIIAHIVSGRCADSLWFPQRHKPLSGMHRERNKTIIVSCEDFARHADLNEHDILNKIVILKIAIKTVSSRKTLFRIMDCSAIHYSSSESLKNLRQTMEKEVRLLQKQNLNQLQNT